VPGRLERAGHGAQAQGKNRVGGGAAVGADEKNFARHASKYIRWPDGLERWQLPQW
jgi:hypothetical protein